MPCLLYISLDLKKGGKPLKTAFNSYKSFLETIKISEQTFCKAHFYTKCKEKIKEKSNEY